MQYTPFRKNFYVEVPEIARMTPEEVDAYKEVQQTVAIITQSYLVVFISDHFLPQILRWKPGCLGVRHRFLSPDLGMLLAGSTVHISDTFSFFYL